jgi:hypothetical protein
MSFPWHSINEVAKALLAWPWLETIGTMVTALAWPLSVLVIVLVLRLQAAALITAFIGRVKDLEEMSGPAGLSAKFGPTLGKAQENLASVPASDQASDESKDQPAEPFDTRSPKPPASDTDAQPPRPRFHATFSDEDQSFLEKVARVSPKLAVVQAFMPVEEAASRLVEAVGGDSRANSVYALRKLNYLPVALRRAVSDLGRLRNQAAHTNDLEISMQEALEFAETALEAAQEIDDIRESLTRPGTRNDLGER